MIRTITLWQPWATFIAEGYKTIETRTHNHFYMLEGERIAIHGGKKYDPDAFEYFDHPAFIEKYKSWGLNKDDMRKMFRKTNINFGVIVCTAMVQKHRRLTPEDSLESCIEIRHGDVRYGLELTDVQKVDPEIEVRGGQGVWHFEGSLNFKGSMNHHERNQLCLF